MKSSIFFEPMMATGDFILHIETDDVTSLMNDKNETNSTDSKQGKEK
jgi:hypothetical protein